MRNPGWNTAGWNDFGKTSHLRQGLNAQLQARVHSKHVHSPNAVSMLGQRRRRWTNIETSLGECSVFAGIISVRGQAGSGQEKQCRLEMEVNHNTDYITAMWPHWSHSMTRDPHVPHYTYICDRIDTKELVPLQPKCYIYVARWQIPRTTLCLQRNEYLQNIATDHDDFFVN